MQNRYIELVLMVRVNFCFFNICLRKKPIAVEFRTHFYNEISREAIERLDANQDGTLRSHQIMANGSIHDTVFYSILQGGSLIVRNNLLSKLIKKL